MGEMDALGLGHEPKQRTVAIKSPRPPFFLDDLQIGLAVAIQQFVADPAVRVLVGQLDGVGSEPLHADNGNEARRQDAANRAVRFDILEARHCHAWATLAKESCRLVSPPSSNARPLFAGLR